MWVVGVWKETFEVMFNFVVFYVIFSWNWVDFLLKLRWLEWLFFIGVFYVQMNENWWIGDIEVNLGCIIFINVYVIHVIIWD